MADSFRISLPPVRIECRDTFATSFRKGCPLKKYLESDESVYVAWPQDKSLLPNTMDFEEACNDIVKMREICDKCKQQTKMVSR